jgi:streptogramin lyase
LLPKLAGIAAMATLAIAPFAHAQTAQSSGAQFMVGAGFVSPFGVAVDSSGNVYVTDVSNNTVNEILAVNGSIPASPTLVTLGSGFNVPIGVAVDGNGNVYVADAGNSAVKEILAVNGSVPASPTIVTLGGNTFVVPIGVAVDASGNVYVTDAGTGSVNEIAAGNGAVTTLATGFTSPGGIAVDGSANVYVADADQTVITEILASNGTTVNVGSGFSNPNGVAVDSSGDVFVAQAGNSPSVQEVLAGTGTIVSLGGGFNSPQGVSLDSSGNVYVADPGIPGVIEIVPHVSFGTVSIGTLSSKITFTFTFQTGGTISLPTVLTQGVAGLDFADAGTGSCTLNYQVQTYNPGDTCTVDVTFTPKFPGARNGAVVLQDSNGNPIATAYLSGIGSGPQVAFFPGTQSTIVSNLNSPSAIAIDGSGNLYFADTANNRVVKEAYSGGSYTLSTIGTGLTAPAGVALDAAGNLFIADSGNSRVVVETPVAGTYTQNTLISGLSAAPQGVAVDQAGDVFIADGGVIEETPANGAYTQTTLNSQGLNVNWVATDNNGDVFLMDSNANEIIRVTPSLGNSSAMPVGSGFSNPSGLAVDAAGNVYVADQGNNQVVRETLSFGSYTQSVLPTGTLNAPSGVAVDNSGNVFITDQDNIVVREDYSDAPAFTFPTATAAGSTDTIDGPLSTFFSNIGNAPLNGGLSLSAGFSQASGSGAPADCNTTFSLAAGATCNLSIEFSPLSSTPAGPVSGTAIFSDNALNAIPNVTQTINLGGTATAPVTVTATHFVVTSSASPVAAGASFNLTITAEDASNSIVSGYSSPVSLASTDANFSSAGTVTLTNGTGTFAVTLGTVGTQSITATSTTGTSITGSVQVSVTAGAPALATVVAGSNQSAYVNAAFATQLQILVVDAFGNPVPGASVLFSAPSSGASTAFAAPYNSNSYQTVATTGTNGIATASVATANGTAGQYNVGASVVGASMGATNFSLTNLSASQYIVTVLTDDAGTAANCVDQANGTGSNSSCSLRDAITAVNAEPSSVSGTISFAPSLTTGGPQTITLTNGVLTLTGGATITGPGANLLTISGGNASQILSISNGVFVTLSGATLTNGSVGASGTGAAIYNNGLLVLNSVAVTGSTVSGSGLGGGIYNDQNANLALNSSTISGNSAGSGGGIYNAASGTVTVIDSTISGNTANGAAGGGIYSDGSLVLSNATVSANSTVSAGAGGGIYAGATSTLSLENSIVAGNTSAGLYADLDAANGVTPDSSNVSSQDPSPTSLITTSLAALANYGGATQTQIPLPGSPAICGGVVANISSGFTADQRGDQRTTSYGSSPCVDAGAVQTNYSLLFVQQPTDTAVNVSITPAPSVQLNESGAIFTGAPATITLALNGTGTLAGGSASTTNGVATYSSASVDTAGTGDTLTANLTLNSATTTTLTATSNTFNVIAGISQLAFGTPPASNVTSGGNAGSAITVQEENAGGAVVTTATDTITLTVTGPNGYVQTYTATAVNGIATFNLSSTALTATGSYLYIATSGTLTDAVTSETVSTGAANTLTVVSGSGQSAAIGSAFSQALTVKVLDANNNAVSGATVVFSAPGSGASATLSAQTATTGANGTASVNATANGLASINPYNVSATVTGNSANFSLTNTQAPTTLTVAPSSTGLVYGQPVVINATISPSSVLTSVPTGTVTFYDGTNALPPAVTVASASASDSVVVPSVGSHTYGAQYSGDTNFSASALKSATYPLIVSKANATLNGPSQQPVSFPAGTGGTTTVTLVGQYTGTGISLPGGSISYVVNGTTNSAPITGGVAIITIPSTWPVGTYTITVSYSGDGNYNAAPSISIPFSITGAGTTSTTTTLTASPTSITVGTSVKLTATVAPASGTTAPTGTVTFNSGGKTLGTGTLSNGVATYATTALPVGTDSITATYTATGSFGNSSSNTVQVTVAPLATLTATTTTLTSSNANAAAGASVTFTATVTPATPVATGTVTFSDGTTTLGTGTLNSMGIATYTTTSLAAGTHSIIAAYGGDTTHSGSTSSALTEMISPAAAASFTITANPTSLSIQQGQSGTVQFTLTSLNGFNQAVTLSCAGLPQFTTCTLPAPVTPTAAGATANVTINTDIAPTSASLQPQSSRPGSANSGSMTALAGGGLAGLALLLGFPARKRLGRSSAFYTALLTLVLSGVLAGMSIGCGGGSSSSTKTPIGTSTVTITATAGSVTQTVAVRMTITQ